MYDLFFLTPIDQIHWDSRFNSWENPSPCGVIDVTECPIDKPNNEDWVYYSKKKGYHTLKYEIVVSMNPKIILWVNGSFAGSIHDLTIARY